MRSVELYEWHGSSSTELCELFCRHRFCVGLRRLKNEHSQHAAVFSIILMASLVHNNWFRCDTTDLHSIFSASLPQAQLFCHNTWSRTPCNFRTITFPLSLETECVFPAHRSLFSLWSLRTDLMHCSCRGWSVGWIVWWRCSHRTHSDTHRRLRCIFTCSFKHVTPKGLYVAL